MEHTDAGVLPPVSLRMGDDDHDHAVAARTAVSLAQRPTAPGLTPRPPAPRLPADGHATAELRLPAPTAYAASPVAAGAPVPAAAPAARLAQGRPVVSGGGLAVDETEDAPDAGDAEDLAADDSDADDDLDDDLLDDADLAAAGPFGAAPGRPGLAEVIDLGLGDLLGEVMEWQERALCAQTDPEAFFPEKGGSTREAKRICSGCEVRTECLEYALANDERFGIWGGMSERERRKQRRRAV
jgi:WhiB family redox-sensing transcriptional regulator